MQTKGEPNSATVEDRTEKYLAHPFSAYRLYKSLSLATGCSLALVLWGSLGQAELLPVTAELKQSTQGFLQPLDGYNSGASVTDLQVGLGFNKTYGATGIGGKLIPWVREVAPYQVGGDPQVAHTFFEVNEGWLEVVRDNWDLRVGNQIISWGNADGYNPTDVWSSVDAIDPFEQARLPLTLARLAIHPLKFEHVILEVVGGPQFRPHRLPVVIGNAGERRSIALTDSRWLIPSPSLIRLGKNTVVPATYHVTGADQSQGLQIGARLRLVRLRGWDLAFTASQTTMAMPAITTSIQGQINQPGLPVDVTIQPAYYRANTFGFDASGTLGPIGVRLDLASRMTVEESVPGIAPVTNVGIIGFDYTLTKKKSEFYINVSYVAKDNPTHSGETDGLGIPDFEPWDRNLVGLLEARFFRHMKLGTRAIASVINQDGWVSPYTNYTFSERYTFEIGMDFFVGSATGAFGQYSDNNRIRSLITAQF